MNKKFLSAILFGALMVTSTGTFVSCKDYDDDIKDLQGQIDSNKDAIAALQKLVGEGKWVTAITSIENGFTITMSDGTSQTVTGINGKDGVDGKNGTEWTIGEDGFWYKDGEKTTSQAVAKNGEDGKPGENGQTANSPYINGDGKWVVYSWNAEKGEFEEVVTEFSAVGTSAYYVEKEGIIYLNIANEAGVFKEIPLPATSDSFVVEAPYAKINVAFETAAWTKWNANSENAKALLKEFPQLANIKAKDIVKQGGNLPIIVTPANVTLSDNFTYTLQNLKGEVADITVSTPVKGLPTSAKIEDDILKTRAAETNSCLWTLKVEPAYYSAKKTYASVMNASLIVENEKGMAVRTPFAYSVISDPITGDVEITPNASAKYAEIIDVFEKPSETEKAIFTLKNQYDSYFILEATNAVQKEKYALSVDGSKLTIGNMPANETSIKVDLKLIALGLNGSTAVKTTTVEISQGVEATGELSAKSVVLNSDPNKAQVRWKLSDLGLTAVQLDNFLNEDGKNAKITATREVAEEDNAGVVSIKKYYAYNSKVIFYNAKGEITTYNSSTSKWNNGNAETFGFNVDAAATPAQALTGYTAEQFTPSEIDYTISLTSAKGNTVIYSANTTLVVTNPDAEAIKLNPAYVEKNAAGEDVLQITAGKYVKAAATNAAVDLQYTMSEGVIIDSKYITSGGVTYIDVDHEEYIGNDSKEFGYENWIATSPTMIVNRWINGNNVPASKQNMYKERRIRAEYTLFGNAKNKVSFYFKAYVKSEVYSADPAKAITMNTLSAVYGGKDGANTVNILKAIKSNVFVAGSDKGKTYDLFASFGGAIKVNAYQYGTIPSAASTDGTLKYALDEKDMMIEIAVTDMKAFGFSADAIQKAQQGDAKYYLLAENTADAGEYKDVKTLADIWGESNVGNKYYAQANSGFYHRIYVDNKEVEIADADKAINTLFSTYAAKVNFAVQKDVEVGVSSTKSADNRIKSVALKVVTEGADKLIQNADKYDGTKNLNLSVNSSYRNIVAVNQLSEGVQDNYPLQMQLIIVDAWNKTMVVPFTITLKTSL